MRLTETKDGTIIEVFVKPSCQKFEMTVDCDEIVVRCIGEPTKGKANKELLKEFTRLFGSRVELVSGATSRQKHLLILGARRVDVERLVRDRSV